MRRKYTSGEQDQSYASRRGDPGPSIVTRLPTNQQLALHHVTAPPEAGDPPYPGLLLLHGRGSNELDLLAIGHALDPRLFVVSARAPFILGPDAYYWYDLEASLLGRPSTESIEFSLGLVHRLMREASEAYEIDPKRFYAGGFSMGAAMSAAAILMNPELVAGAILLSGYAPLHSNLPSVFRTSPASPSFKPTASTTRSSQSNSVVKLGTIFRAFRLP